MSREKIDFTHAMADPFVREKLLSCAHVLASFLGYVESYSPTIKNLSGAGPFVELTPFRIFWSRGTSFDKYRSAKTKRLTPSGLRLWIRDGRFNKEKVKTKFGVYPEAKNGFCKFPVEGGNSIGVISLIEEICDGV